MPDSLCLVLGMVVKVELLIDWLLGPLEPKGWVCIGSRPLKVPALRCLSFPLGSAVTRGIWDLARVIQTVSRVVLAHFGVGAGTCSPLHGCAGLNFLGSFLCFPLMQLGGQHKCIGLSDRSLPGSPSQKPSSACLSHNSTMPN